MNGTVKRSFLVRLLSLMLGVIMVCTMPTMASAANKTIFHQEDSFSDYTSVRAAAVNDTGVFVYLQGREDQLLFLPKGETEAVRLSTDTAPVSSDQLTPEEIAAIQAGEITPPMPLMLGASIAGDGKRLYSIDTHAKAIVEVHVKDDGIQLEEVVQLEDVSSMMVDPASDYVYLAEQRAAFVMADKYFFLADLFDSAVLTVLDMKTGKAIVPDVPRLQFAAPYKDGTVLLMATPEESIMEQDGTYSQPLEFLLYHPDTNTTEKWATIQGTFTQGMTYLPETDQVVLAQGSGLYIVDPAAGARQVGTLPPLSDMSISLLPYGKQVLVQNRNFVALRDVSTAFDPTAVIQISGYHSLAADLHFEQHNSIGVGHWDAWMRGTTYMEDLITQGGADVLGLSAPDSIISKGYYVDLSDDPELMAYVNSLHPLYQKEVLRDGKLIGIPIATQKNTLQIDPEVVKTMGLTVRDLPTDVMGLMAFITRWNDTWTEDHPDLKPILSFEDMRVEVFRYMIQSYVMYMEYEKQPLRFDTETFRQLMAAFQDMRTDNFPKGDDANIIFGGSYLYSTNYSNLFETRYLTTFNDVTMPLKKNAPAILPIDLTILMVNPYTAHREAAIAYLKSAIATLHTDHQYALLAKMDQPLKNPTYDRDKKEMDEWLKSAEEMAARQEKEGLTDASGYQEVIRSLKDNIERLEKSKYLVTRQNIANYRKQLKNGAMVVHGSSLDLFEDESLQLGLWVDNLLGGSISLEDFIQQVDKVLGMMEMEQ